MKTSTASRLNKISLFAALAAASLIISAPSARAVNYSGNGSTGFSGAIGTGVMALSDDGTTISGHLTFGGSFNDTLVIYVDTGAASTFTTTTNFNDQGDGTRQAISGVSGSGRSALTFTNGFTPSYALGISSGFGGLWQLANGGNNSLPFVTSVNYNNGNGTFSFPASAIGLTSGQQKTIKIFGTYISSSAYRSTEAIAGNDFGPFGPGWNPFTQTAYGTYTFAPAVTPSYAVKFSVDMTAQIQLGKFTPGTDPVYCGGSFQTNAFAFSDFQLFASNGTAIYTNTYQDFNPTNTLETYKFKYTSSVLAADVYDSDPNRSFVLAAGGQVLPLVYFDNLPASPPATTHVIKFSVDMGPQVYLGHFHPENGDLLQVFGSFESPRWSGNFPPVGVLTNNVNLSGAQTNIYYGEFLDGNYAGTVNQYKYAIVNVVDPANGTTNYESGSDRSLVTPAANVTLPLAYFNGVSNIYATPITFLVDMTVPIAIHEFDVSRGDTVGCAGSFQTNSFGTGVNGFTLSLLSGNIYRGTYVDHNAPGTGEQYKFVINTNGTDTLYELYGLPNRQFLLGSTAATNPLVFWSNLSPNDVLLVDTLVTFTVDMTGAVDRFGYPFIPEQDAVLVDGDYLQPAFPVMKNFDDATIALDYPDHFMQRVTPDGLLYTNQVTVSAGSPVKVAYKYGIFHDSSPNANTNVDNEAGFALNHTRYIRVSGAANTYQFPTDAFGQQRNDLPGATEPAFGQLAIGNKSGGNFPITWLGLRGVHLQFSTNLLSGAWQDINGTDGMNSTNWPATIAPRYFRLIQP